MRKDIERGERGNYLANTVFVDFITIIMGEKGRNLLFYMKLLKFLAIKIEEEKEIGEAVAVEDV